MKSFFTGFPFYGNDEAAFDPRSYLHRIAKHMQPGNLFTDAHAPHEGERFETILSHRNVVIERIISSATIAPHEYVQAQDEWVLLLNGEAVIQLAGESMSLKSGDYLFLPAGVPHTVERTSEGAIWLAIHLHS